MNKDFKIRIKLNNQNHLVIRPFNLYNDEIRAIQKQLIINRDCIKPLVRINNNVFEITHNFKEEIGDELYIINNGIILRHLIDLKHNLVSIGFLSIKYNDIYIANTTNTSLLIQKFKLPEEECISMIDFQLSKETDYISAASLVGILKMNTTYKEYVYNDNSREYNLEKYVYDIDKCNNIKFYYCNNQLMEISA